GIGPKTFGVVVREALGVLGRGRRGGHWVLTSLGIPLQRSLCQRTSHPGDSRVRAAPTRRWSHGTPRLVTALFAGCGLERGGLRLCPLGPRRLGLCRLGLCLLGLCLFGGRRRLPVRVARHRRCLLAVEPALEEP